MGGEIKSLTGCRGIAALFVVLFHLNQHYGADIATGNYILQFFRKVVSKGYLSVDLFFMLSAYVLSLSYEEKFQRINMQQYLLFLKKRLIRIYPLYLIITSIYFIVKIYSSAHITTKLLLSYPVNLLFLQVNAPTLNLNGPSWSLCTEFYIYLIFPILLHKLNKNVLSYFLVGFFGILLLPVVLNYKAFLGGGFFFNKELNYNIFLKYGAILRTLFDYCFGLWLFHFSKNEKIFKIIFKLRYFILISFAVVSFVWLNDGIAIILMGFGLVTLTKHSLLYRFLASRPIYFIGLISFSLYITQYLFIGKFGNGALELVLIFITSIITFNLIETKLSAIIKRGLMINPLPVMASKINGKNLNGDSS